MNGSPPVAAPRMRRMRLLNSVSISPVAQLATAACTAAAAVVAARQGQFADIAGYSAGLGIAGVVGVVAGGGSTLVFLTGDEPTRAAIRLARWVFIAPITLLLSVLASVVYAGAIHQLPLGAMLLGSTSVVLTNLASLDGAQLQRNGRLLVWGTTSVFSRLVPVVTLLFGLRFSVSMTLGNVVFLATCALLLRGERRERNAGVRLSGRRSIAELLTRCYKRDTALLSFFDSVMLRAPFVAAPLALTAVQSGALSVLMSSQQSIAALLASTLYTIMAVRGAPADGRGHLHGRIERLVVIGSIPVAALGALAAPLVIWIFQAGAVGLSSTTWVVLMCALPFTTFNRAVQYRALSTGRSRAAMVLLATICLPTVLTVVVSIVISSPDVLAASSLVGELVGTLSIVQRRGKLGLAVARPGRRTRSMSPQ